MSGTDMFMFDASFDIGQVVAAGSKFASEVGGMVVAQFNTLAQGIAPAISGGVTTLTAQTPQSIPNLAEAANGLHA